VNINFQNIFKLDEDTEPILSDCDSSL